MTSKKKLRRRASEWQFTFDMCNQELEHTRVVLTGTRAARDHAKSEADKLRVELVRLRAAAAAVRELRELLDMDASEPAAKTITASGGQTKPYPKFGEPGTYTINNEQAA